MFRRSCETEYLKRTGNSIMVADLDYNGDGHFNRLRQDSAMTVYSERGQPFCACWEATYLKETYFLLLFYGIKRWWVGGLGAVESEGDVALFPSVVYGTWYVGEPVICFQGTSTLSNLTGTSSLLLCAYRIITPDLIYAMNARRSSHLSNLTDMFKTCAPSRA